MPPIKPEIHTEPVLPTLGQLESSQDGLIDAALDSHPNADPAMARLLDELTGPAKPIIPDIYGSDRDYSESLAGKMEKFIDDNRTDFHTSRIGMGHGHADLVEDHAEIDWRNIFVDVTDMDDIPQKNITGCTHRTDEQFRAELETLHEQGGRRIAEYRLMEGR